tara:strand:- start:847 stop:1083 length:237 start_codon:yes stop_codon:yes gene_type:complete
MVANALVIAPYACGYGAALEAVFVAQYASRRVMPRVARAMTVACLAVRLGMRRERQSDSPQLACLSPGIRCHEKAEMT